MHAHVCEVNRWFWPGVFLEIFGPYPPRYFCTQAQNGALIGNRLGPGGQLAGAGAYWSEQYRVGGLPVRI